MISWMRKVSRVGQGRAENSPPGRTRPWHWRSRRAQSPLPPARPRVAQDTACDLLIAEYLAYPQDALVDDVLDDLRANAQKYVSYDVQYAYVLSPRGRLAGVLRLRDLVLSPRQTPIAMVMILDPIRVSDRADLEQIQAVFDQNTLFGIPVVDAEGRMRGVVRRGDVQRVVQERANRMFLKFTGIVGGEELRSMPWRTRSLRRLSWLSMNVFLNVAAAGIIAWHQDTLRAVISLAVFLPILSDMSGCSGNQAVAVTMRELALGLVRPCNAWKVLRKELAIGLVNGLVLGLLLGSLACLWKGSLALGLVVGAALALNTIIAVSLGGLIPLLLKKFKQDPALASGPILTTLTDTCGFLLILTFARAMLPWLSRAGG